MLKNIIARITFAPHKIQMIRPWQPIINSSIMRKKPVNFITSSTKLITFPTHEEDLGFSPEIDGRLCCQQVSYIERLQGRELNPDLQWNSYIRFYPKDNGKNGRFLVPLQNLPSFPALSLQESNQIKIDYCCLIWTEATTPYFQLSIPYSV